MENINLCFLAVLEEIDDSSDDENNEDSKKDKAQESNNNKSENKPEEKIPDDVPLIFENVKVKEEPIDETGKMPFHYYYTIF